MPSFDRIQRRGLFRAARVRGSRGAALGGGMRGGGGWGGCLGELHGAGELRGGRRRHIGASGVGIGEGEQRQSGEDSEDRGFGRKKMEGLFAKLPARRVFR